MKNYWAIAIVIVISLTVFLPNYSLKSNNLTSMFTSSANDNPNAAKLEAKTYEFETLTLNASAKEVRRNKAQASYYSEELGDGVKLDMVKIPGGVFLMGSDGKEHGRSKNEGPQHKVKISDFYIGKFEVTQAQWKNIMSDNPSRYKGDDLPVDSVSWENAIKFCQRLSKITGREYRLPSEAEWEYACRAGTTTPFAFGETILSNIVNYDGTPYPIKLNILGAYRGKTLPVGSFGIANSFGLYDMHGNVWEWCLDLYHDNYSNAPTNGQAWETGTDSKRVVRGGSFFLSAYISRSAYRTGYNPDEYLDCFGFRVVCLPDKVY
ncbi:MAG: formylglycine-generating enzyme family protein [Acidobacteria bacterium]|nr:formylglycine-generating enzyme family protein [Acidobacteriota bacterium]